MTARKDATMCFNTVFIYEYFIFISPCAKKRATTITRQQKMYYNDQTRPDEIF